MLKPEIKMQWLEALRSGHYQQARGVLRQDAIHFCCLGVLCDLIEPKWLLYDGQYIHARGNRMSMPTELSARVGIAFESRNELMNMNDNNKDSFSDIADWIEANL